MKIEYSPTYSILRGCPEQLVSGLSQRMEHCIEEDQLRTFVNAVGKGFPFTKSYTFKATLNNDDGTYDIKLYSGFIRTVLMFLTSIGERPEIISTVPKYKCSDITISEVLRDHQKKIVNKSLLSKRGIIKSPTGCHTKGTKVLMFDGTFKKVEDVKVNDLLMGPDNKPRKVLSLCRGKGSIYKLSSNSKRTNKFQDLFINDEHILSLKHTKTNKVVNISVKDYLQKSNWFKHCHKLYMNDKVLSFKDEKKYLQFNPYLLGIYLGDGHSNTFAITTADKQIEEYAINCLGAPQHISIKGNCKTLKWSSKNNKDLNYLRSLGLNITLGKNALTCSSKFIPQVYKTTSAYNRLKLLAGLIDSDGWLEKNYYCFTSKSKQLAEDVAFVGRSLGFYCRLKEKPTGYYLVTILGDIKNIPVLLKRKTYTAPQFRNRSVYKYGFDLDYIKEDKYYGFSLDGDSLYLTDEFIITHNSGKSYAIAELVRKLTNDGLKVLVTVPTISLLDQLTKDIHDFRKLDGCEPIEIGQVGNGKYDFKNVTVGIPNSLSKLDKTQEYLETVDALIADEVHTCANATYAVMVSAMNNRKVSLGLSATPENSPLLEAFFSTRIVEIQETEMIEKGIILDPLFEFYPAPKAYVPKATAIPAGNIQNLPNAYRYKVLAAAYNYIIINNSARNKLIVKKAVQRIKKDLGPVLVIVNKVKGENSHADILVDLFKEQGYRLPVISGYIAKKRKEKLIDDLKESKIVGAIAGPKVLSAGISIPSLSTIVLAGAGRSDTEFIQRVGRILRKNEGKDRPLVIDFQDQQFWFASQSRSRMATAEQIYGTDNIILR